MTPEDLIESYEERAAIMEYDGGLSRAEAEKRSALYLTGLIKERARVSLLLGNPVDERLVRPECVIELLSNA